MSGKAKSGALTPAFRRIFIVRSRNQLACDVAGADVLDQRGLTFVVVDIDPDHCRELEDHGKHVVRGDATDEKVLASTNIATERRCRLGGKTRCGVET